MTWLDTVEDDRGVLAVFGQAPSLESIDVQGVSLHHNGPRIVLAFALRDYPADPPKKWVAQGFTVAQMSLSLVDVRDVRLAGWDVDVVGDLTLDRVDGGVAVAFTSPATTFTCTAAFVYVQGISAYQEAPPDAPW
jgi:Immunity protein 50